MSFWSLAPCISLSQLTFTIFFLLRLLNHSQCDSSDLPLVSGQPKARNGSGIGIWGGGVWDIPYWSSGLGRTNIGMAWIRIDTCLTISNCQLISAEENARISVVGHCNHVTSPFMSSQTYDSNPGPNCDCKSRATCMKNTIFLLCSDINGCYSRSILALCFETSK